MTYQYETNCVNSTAKLINDMLDVGKEINHRTFFKYVDWKYVSSMLGYALHPKQGLMLSQDCLVTYGKSVYNGRKCYYIQWSAIEYIWVERD